MNSFFVEVEEVKIGEKFYLRDVEHNHLSRVLRMKVGDLIQVYPNDDRVLVCQIESINKKETLVEVKDVQTANTNPKNHLDVFTALLKGDKFEFLITKLTELGVTKLIPFESEFCVGKNNNDKSLRHAQIAKDACKQCKRSRTIEIAQVHSFEEMKNKIKEYDLVLFAYENECQKSLSSVLDLIQNKMKVAIIIGSEGGFSKKEVEEICQSGAIVISLGNRILRAETASLMLSSIVLNKMNEYDLKNS